MAYGGLGPCAETNDSDVLKGAWLRLCMLPDRSNMLPVRPNDDGFVGQVACKLCTTQNYNIKIIRKRRKTEDEEDDEKKEDEDEEDEGEEEKEDEKDDKQEEEKEDEDDKEEEKKKKVV